MTVMDAAEVKTGLTLTAIPEALEEWRERLGVSREKFAVATLGVSSSTYERWLRGSFNPSLHTTLRLLALLNDSDLVPARLSGKTDTALAELWENPLDASYDEL